MTQVITDDMRSTNVPSSGPRSQRVCRHFARGRCTWGTSCRFSHDVDRSTLDEPPVGNHGYIAEQQQVLQKKRHAILRAALDGEFEIKPFDADGVHQYSVHLNNWSPILLAQLLSEEALQQQLQQLERDEELRIRGILFLVGEPVVFWSMMQMYCLRRTTTSTKWDMLLTSAKRGCVECMFFRSPTGCLSSDCPFLHNTAPTVSIPSPLQNMATNNALLTPLLGFGTTTLSTPKSVQNAVRIPTDTTRHISAAPLLVNKGDDAVVFRDPVWGPCLPDLRTTTENQESLCLPWESGVRVSSESVW